MGWLDERDWYNDRIFEAFITKEEIDRQRHRCAEMPGTICAGDKISIEGFKEVMPWLIKYGVIHYKHSNINFGEPLAWRVEDDRIKLKIGVHSNFKSLFPLYDKIWQEIKSFHNDSTKKSYMSIGGQSPLSPHTKCDKEKCWDEIYKLGVFEVSWVGENPANLGAEVDRVNVLAKGNETIEDVLIDLLAKSDAELLQKPFGPWADWDACMAEMGKKYDTETAEKVCGRLKARLEKIRETKMGEEEEKKGVEKQEGEMPGDGGAPAAAPEVNPLEAIMGRLDAIEARMTAIEEKIAPPAAGEGAGEGEVKGNEPKTAAPAPGELKVSFKSDLKEVMDESLPNLVKGAVKEYFEEAKILAKGGQKPVQKEGGQDSGSTVLEKAMEEADKAQSAKEFFA